MRSTSFFGVGTTVALDNNGDRIVSYEVMNYVPYADGVASVRIGLYNSTERKYTASERTVKWPGNLTEVPVSWAPFQCPPGKFAVQSKLSSCVPCSFPREFQDQFGATACKNCPYGTRRVRPNSLAKNISDCKCRPEFWARTNLTYLCERCPENAVCEGTDALPYGKPGFWGQEHDR